MNFQDLRAKALAATPGEWKAVNWQGHHPATGFYDEWYLDTNDKPCDYFEESPGEYKNNHWDLERAKKDIEYMAAANPQVILKLLDELVENYRIRDIMRDRLKEANAKLSKIQKVLGK